MRQFTSPSLRQSIAPRRSFVDSPGPRRPEERARRTVPGVIARRALRLALALAAAPLVAVAGIAYVVLLPICGIASLLEGFLSAAWSWMRAGAQTGEAPRRRTS